MMKKTYSNNIKYVFRFNDHKLKQTQVEVHPNLNSYRFVLLRYPVFPPCSNLEVFAFYLNHSFPVDREKKSFNCPCRFKLMNYSLNQTRRDQTGCGEV